MIWPSGTEIIFKKKNVNSQQHTYRAHSSRTFPLLFVVSESLCAKIASPADVKEQTWTQSPAKSAVNQGGVYFQNFENSQKIEEIAYNYDFFHQCDQQQNIFFTAAKKV